MKILYLDLDTLRADHLGCYGYHRNTSPNIDRIAAEGVRFDNYYTPDAPCLPSRTALMTGMFGIHNGVVGHGGTAADLRLEGPNRGFRTQLNHTSLPGMLRAAGLHTTFIGGFGERHSTWSFYAGFSEIHDTGKGGLESAEEVTPTVLDWIERNANRENWYLHINYWDPHTPYRSPAEFGNPFENDPLPGWITPEILEHHRSLPGPHGAQEINMFDNAEDPRYPRHPGEIKDMADLRKLFDGYDCGIRYMDTHIGQVIAALEAKGVMDDLAIIISSDHGENMGELGIYAEHGSADSITCRIPMIIRWPGGPQGKVDTSLHYNLDLLPTLADLFHRPHAAHWDGKSYATSLVEPVETRLTETTPVETTTEGSRQARPADTPLVEPVETRLIETTEGSRQARTAVTPLVEPVETRLIETSTQGPRPADLRDYLVISQNAHICQRSVRWGPWLYLRTYHDGYRLFPEEMLYHIEDDPHLQHDLAPQRADVLLETRSRLAAWTDEMLATMPEGYTVDPMRTVMAEGGPFHTRGALPKYLQRLRATGRGHHADELERRHPDER
jgi:arylsulfatase A-like enzyme